MLKKFAVLAVFALVGTSAFAQQSQVLVQDNQVTITGDAATMIKYGLTYVTTGRMINSAAVFQMTGVACEIGQNAANCIQNSDRVYAGILRSALEGSAVNSEVFVRNLLRALEQVKKPTDPEGVTLADYLVNIEGDLRTIYLSSINCTNQQGDTRTVCTLVSDRFAMQLN